jgi:hypothetical protein
MEVTLALVKKPKIKNQSEPPANLGIRLEPLEGVPVYYVNFVEVGNSPQDFTLTCGRMPGKFTSAKIEEIKTIGAVVIEPEVQIIIPPAVVPGLIRALSVQKESYEETYQLEIKEVGGK